MIPFSNEWKCELCKTLNALVSTHCRNCGQRRTQNSCAQEPSNSRGTSVSPIPFSKDSTKILELLERITAQQEMFAGISFGQSERNPYLPWDQGGTLTTEQKLRESINVSFAKLKSELLDLLTHAVAAENDITDFPAAKGSSTS
jgi:hypothetical protein